jgi:hypothetical protein
MGTDIRDPSGSRKFISLALSQRVTGGGLEYKCPDGAIIFSDLIGKPDLIRVALRQVRARRVLRIAGYET